MGLHIILQDYSTHTEYDLPCVSGKLTEINALTAGQKHDKNGVLWTIQRTNYNNGGREIILSTPYMGTSYNIGDMEEIFASLGFGLDNYAMNFESYFAEINTTWRYLRPDSVDTQYPCYEMRKTGPATVGYNRNQYTYDFDLDPGNSRAYSYVSYEQYNGQTMTSKQSVYGGALALETTSGLGDFVFGDIVIVQLKAGTRVNYEIHIYFNVEINGVNWGMPDFSPGDKGFRPTGAFTKPNKPGVGGRGSTGKIDPDYKADQIFQPGAPDETSASAIGSGFINLYKMSQSELNKICACLYSQTLLDAIASIAINPLDFIISLMIFPCAPNVGTSEGIKFGKWQCLGGSAVTDLGTAITGARLSSQYKTVSFGTLAIPENWGSFLDYSHTDIELYLPFIGSVTIDPSECMGGTINVEYTVDFLTGQCVANVLCSRPNAQLPNGKALSHVQAQHSYQGNCAVQIPLSAESYGAMVGNLINACCKTVVNPVAGIAGAVVDGANGGFRPNISTKGSIVANSGFCSVLYPYVRITRPITAEPESYQEIVGYPSYINTSIGQCAGLCVCDDIDLSGITGATEAELDEIARMCKEGIWV